MIDPFLQQKLPQIINLFQKHRVMEAYAFGSVCTDNFNSESDIDILVDFDKNMKPEDKGEMIWQIWDELENLLNRKVDLLTKTSLTNPYFIEELNEKKVLLYGKAA